MPKVNNGDLIKQAVQAHLPSESVLRRSLHACPRLHSHKPIASFGKKNWENVGLILEICCGPQDDKCAHHLKPLPRQMSDEDKLAMFVQLSTLEEPPYGKELYRAQTILLREECRELVESEMVGPRTPSSRTTIPRTPTSRVSIPRTPSSRNADARARALGSRSVGRPANPRVSVDVWIYLADGLKPVKAVIEGILRDDQVEVVFRQAELWAKLGWDMSSGLDDYEVWNRDLKKFVKYPRPHQTYFVLPGERLLYRDKQCQCPYRLDHYTSRLLPRPPANFFDDAPSSSAGPSRISRVPLRPSSPPPSSSDIMQTPRKCDHQADLGSSRKRRKYQEPVLDLSSSPEPEVIGKGKGKARMHPHPENDVIEISD